MRGAAVGYCCERRLISARGNANDWRALIFRGGGRGRGEMRWAQFPIDAEKWWLPYVNERRVSVATSQAGAWHQTLGVIPQSSFYFAKSFSKTRVENKRGPRNELRNVKLTVKISVVARFRRFSRPAELSCPFKFVVRRADLLPRVAEHTDPLPANWQEALHIRYDYGSRNRKSNTD